jgi:hypothetical protein
MIKGDWSVQFSSCWILLGSLSPPQQTQEVARLPRRPEEAPAPGPLLQQPQGPSVRPRPADQAEDAQPLAQPQADQAREGDGSDALAGDDDCRRRQPRLSRGQGLPRGHRGHYEVSLYR